MRLKIRLTSGEQGQALVEFAFVLIFLLMLSGGIADGVNIIRHQIALHGAATEVANQISRIGLNPADVNKLCDRVINTNFRNSLGDKRTTVHYERAGRRKDTILYHYRNELHEPWSGNREYETAIITLKRDQELLTPFGQLVFGNTQNGRIRKMEVTARTRVYTDTNY